MSPRERHLVRAAALAGLALAAAGCQERIVGARGFGADAAITAPGARTAKAYSTTTLKPRKEKPKLDKVRRTRSPLGEGGGYGSGLHGEVSPPPR